MILDNIKNELAKQDLDNIITYGLLSNTDGDKIYNIIKYIESLEQEIYNLTK